MFRRSAPVFDGAFVAAVTILSLIWYAPSLGFYSDDWAFLGAYATSPDQTIRGLHDASYSAQHAMRPVQLWLCAVLFGAFGMAPAGYHLVNAGFVVLNPLLVYAIARALRLPRVMGLAVALTYGLLPSYSTDRYWFVAFAITFSMTAALTSLYADVRAFSAQSATKAVFWKTIAALALCVSVLAYEVVLPLLLVAAPAVMAWRLWADRGALTRRRIACVAAMVAINLVLLGGATLFKLRTTVRLGAEQGVAAQVAAIARHAIRVDLPRGEYGLNLLNAARVHFVEYGVQLPGNALALAPAAPPAVLGLAFAAVLATVIYLAVTLRTEPWPSAPAWCLLVGAGLGVFGLGYAVFLTNYNVQFTTTGIANRSAIVAALGAAMCIAGVVGLLLTPVRSPRVRTILFAGVIAVTTGSGFLIVNVVADYWIRAYAAERNILVSLRDRVPALPAGSTLLLEGTCPYVGPAIVFEADWDLGGALQVYYRDRTLAANVVTPRMTADVAGITASIYGQPTRYPYSPSLVAYHAGTGAVLPLQDAATARAWLSRSLGSTICPPGQEGIGVELF